MKTTHTKTLLTAFATCSLTFAGSAPAAILVSSTFDLNPSTAVSTTGTSDWGYFIIKGNNGVDAVLDSNPSGVAFASLVDGDGTSVTVRDGSPAIGAVTFTETGAAGGTTASAFTGFTFDGNATGNIAGSISGSEEIFSMTFNDVGAGTNTLTFYMGASNTGRQIDVDYSVAASDGNISDTGLLSGDLANNRVSYTLVFTTTDASADLTLNIGSAGGGTNAFELNGYTLTNVPVPEPGSLALVAMGGICLLRRRRS